MLKGRPIFHDFVLLVVTLLSTIKSVEFETNSSEKKLRKAIQDANLRAKVVNAIFSVPEQASSLFTTIGLVLAELILKVSSYFLMSFFRSPS